MTNLISSVQLLGATDLQEQQQQLQQQQQGGGLLPCARGNGGGWVLFAGVGFGSEVGLYRSLGGDGGGLLGLFRAVR